MHRNLPPVRGTDVTPEPIYRSRRECLKALGLGAIALTAGCESGAAPDSQPVVSAIAPRPSAWRHWRRLR